MREIAFLKLIRLRSNRCLYSAPPAYSGRGRPPPHGEKFQLNDPQTWWAAEEKVELDDPKLVKLGANIQTIKQPRLYPYMST